MIVDDIIAGKHRMHGAEECVGKGFQVLGADGRQPPHADSLVLRDRRGEVCTAIDSYLVPHAGEFSADLLVVGLNSTVLGDKSSTSDERDSQAGRRRLWRSSGHDGNRNLR